MQVSYDEGLAIHIGPESCAVAREGFGEALTGGRIGQPLSCESFLFWVPTPCRSWKATTSGRVIASVRTTRRGQRPWHVQTLLAREPGDLAIDRLATAAGPHREGEEPEPMMHGREKSDSAIVAEKPTNKVVSATAEPVEPRAGAKGNASQQSTLRTQCRKCVSQALERIRQVRRHSPKVGAVCGVR